MISRILCAGFAVSAMLVSHLAFAAPSVQKVEWEDAGDTKQLVKTYPFVKEVLDDVTNVVGQGAFGGATHIMTSNIKLDDKTSFMILQINDNSYCGSATGCANVIYVDQGEGFSIAKETQLPGNIYVGLCEKTPVMVAQMEEFVTTPESFKTFVLKDKKFEDGKYFSKLEDVDLCAK